MRFNFCTDTGHKAKSFITNSAYADAFVLAFPFLHPRHHQTQDVGVETTAQSFVRGDNNHSDILDDIAFDQKWMLIFRISARQMRCNLTNFFRIRASSTHTFLSLTHLGSCHHFHGSSNLARIFYALDFSSYFFAASHYLVPSLVNCSGLEFINCSNQDFFVVGRQILTGFDGLL